MHILHAEDIAKDEEATEAEIARLRAEVEKLEVQIAGCLTAAEGVGLDQAAKQGDYGWSLAYQRTLDLRAEVEKLEADVVWAVRNGACAGYDGSSWPCITYAPSGTETYEYRKALSQIEYDGTDAGLLSAVRRAREGTDDEAQSC